MERGATAESANPPGLLPPAQTRIPRKAGIPSECYFEKIRGATLDRISRAQRSRGSIQALRMRREHKDDRDFREETVKPLQRFRRQFAVSVLNDYSAFACYVAQERTRGKCELFANNRALAISRESETKIGQARSLCAPGQFVGFNQDTPSWSVDGNAFIARPRRPQALTTERRDVRLPAWSVRRTDSQCESAR